MVLTSTLSVGRKHHASSSIQLHVAVGDVAPDFQVRK